MARTNREAWLKAVQEQREWIEKCGGNLAGYIAHYGSKDDAVHYGNGGEAIFAADSAVLRAREALLAKAKK